MIPGHEFTGYVAASRVEVTGLTDGQPVVVDMNIGCANCYWCRRNEILNCPEMRQMGITMDGAFAEYIAVPARLAIPAPAGTPVEALVLTEPLSCVVRAARKARVTFGQSVVVMGAGPIGNLHVQLLRTIGAAPIIVSDVSAERCARAREGGADIAVPPEELIDAVMTATQQRGAGVRSKGIGEERWPYRGFRVDRCG